MSREDYRTGGIVRSCSTDARFNLWVQLPVGGDQGYFAGATAVRLTPSTWRVWT